MSHKSMPKWRPFQTAGEVPRILPVAAAIMKENSAAPHPPILHGNGPDSPSPPANLEDLDQFVSGIKSSLRDQISSLLALDSGPYMAYGNRGWPIHHNFGQKKTVHSFPTDRPPPQVNHQKWFSIFWLSDSTFSLKTLKINLVDRRI